MDSVFRALADDTRRRILALVWREERSAGDIAAAFAVTRPAISQHLRVLREAGLITVRRQGTKRLYTARPEALAGARAAIEAFWSDRLDHLKNLVEGETAVEAGQQAGPEAGPMREAAE